MQEIIQAPDPDEKDEFTIPFYVRSRKLWFEGIIFKLRLPLWIGIPLVSLGPAVALWSLGINIRIATDFTGVPIVSLPLVILNMLFLVSSSRQICIHSERLRQYTGTMSRGLGLSGLSRLYSLKPVALIWGILILASGLVFDPLIFKLYYPLYQSLLRVVVTSYLRLAQATFLWVLGYSMYSIYKWGKLPIKLNSFTDDPTLGLKPYGTTSLFFVTLYIVGILLTFPVGVYVGEAILTSQAIFYLLGIVIFLGPLLGLRKKLLKAREAKLDWIRARHRRVMELLESSGEAPFDVAVSVELMAIDNIRRDVQLIHGWPFNLGMLAKLMTVVIAPLILAMIATYLIHILQL